MSDLKTVLVQALMRGAARKETEKVVEDALNSGLSADTILKEGFVPAVTVIMDCVNAGLNNETPEDGEKMYLPELLVALHVMAGILSSLAPASPDGAVESVGTAVIGAGLDPSKAGYMEPIQDVRLGGTKKELQKARFHVVDLGHNVSREQVNEAAATHGTSMKMFFPSRKKS